MLIPKKQFTPTPVQQLQALSKEELVEFIEIQQIKYQQTIKDYEKLSAYIKELEEKVIIIEGERILLKNKFFGKSSERRPIIIRDKQSEKIKHRKKKKKVQLPSLRYPDCEVARSFG